jgi:hypothetical protein
MSDASTLYREDFLAWSERQVAALRAEARNGSNKALDWENLAEEIEGLGISQRSALGSQIRRAEHHLLKLEHSLTRAPRQGWRDSIVDARVEIEDLLERSPSLKREVDSEIAKQMARAIRLAIRDLERRRELDAATLARIRATTYSEDQVVGDWFPPEPEREPSAEKP